MNEEEVSIRHRYLRLDGIVSPSSLGLVEQGLPRDLPPHSRICFVDFADADFGLPRRFDTVFDLADPDRHWTVEVEIVAVTQQWGIPLDLIPHGWKTICVLVFSHGVPEIIDSLPVVDRWYGAFRHILGLCERYVYPEIAAGCRADAARRDAAGADGNAGFQDRGNGNS
jgi:hypothetical protein